MRTYDKLIAAICARQGTVGLRPTFGDVLRLAGGSFTAPSAHPPQASSA